MVFAARHASEQLSVDKIWQIYVLLRELFIGKQIINRFVAFGF